ncbi:hypothetical protein [Saccharopolyspora sp. NPDC002686]|uniref:hypothetical protein n=1 Tax=Saccharopolyspora sp. NPDC002686 TaxID=3154541 RepID=UPI003321656C
MAITGAHGQNEAELRHAQATYVTRKTPRRAIITVVNAILKARDPTWCGEATSAASGSAQQARPDAAQGRRRRRHRMAHHPARLLPRLLAGRRAGPVFLTDRRARVVLPPGDLDLGSGRVRLSYRRAAELFEQTTTNCPGGPWTLHQLRHSALTHAAEDGA